ncbi:NAD-P-binding protein [Schizopora paradoxa]|uniref:NAD-P-binding protein n=1 Tax=Schizopora paradoxa TaxID=27342 RepID=A0A0H2RZW4_9AGAM|nr:NAD-P-binding protein [Schizopora paradoxa]
MSDGKPIVLVTGATGYVGAHIVEKALATKYPVRVTCRPNKVNEVCQYYGDQVEVCEITDIAKCDYTEALKGVWAVIHAEAPISGGETKEELVQSFVHGTMNIIEQGYAAGVKKFIITSTIMTMVDLDKFPEVFDNNKTYTAKDWNPIASEEAILVGEHDSYWVYAASKTIAEKRAWSFAEAHPDADITTIHPSLVYGPPTGIHIPSCDLRAPSTQFLLYCNLFKMPGGGGAMPPVPPLHVDVRDIAKAHVLALTAPPASKVGGHKRIPLSAPSFHFDQAIEHLAKVRPDLKDRLADQSAGGDAMPKGMASVDETRVKEALGFEEFIPWQKTVEDSVDNFAVLEKEWFKQ